jgi:hypothetical protein
MRKPISLAMVTTLFLLNFVTSVVAESKIVDPKDTSKCRATIQRVWNKRVKNRQLQPATTITARQDDTNWAGQLVFLQKRGESKWCHMKNVAK